MNMSKDLVENVGNMCEQSSAKMWKLRKTNGNKNHKIRDEEYHPDSVGLS